MKHTISIVVCFALFTIVSVVTGDGTLILFMLGYMLAWAFLRLQPWLRRNVHSQKFWQFMDLILREE